MRREFAFLLFVSLVHPSDAQVIDPLSFSKPQQMLLSELSDDDRCVLGERALTIHPEEWKHTEGDHFIYHHGRESVLPKVVTEAETADRVALKLLGKELDADRRKAHIYLFDREDDFKEFMRAAKWEQLTGGVQQENSIFVWRPGRRAGDGDAVRHAVGHVILWRYYGSRVPCWLDEGFASLTVSETLAEEKLSGRVLARSRDVRLQHGDPIPLEELVSLQGVRYDRPLGGLLFYNEAEHLVRFLETTDQGRFLSIVQAVANGEKFDSAFDRIYKGVYSSRKDFETQLNAQQPSTEPVTP